MFRFVVLTSLLASALAGGYGSYGGGYSSMGSSMDSSMSLGGYGSGLSMGSMRGPYLGGSSMGLGMGSMGSSLGMGSSMGMGMSGYSGGLIPAAVQSRRSIQFIDTPSIMAAPIPLTLSVPASQQPITFQFQGQSSPLDLQSTFQGQAGTYQESSSTDEPQVRVHTVSRPVIQKQTEIIAPYRQIRQEVLPVQEQVSTLVSRGSGYQQTQTLDKGYQTGYIAAPVLGYQTTGSTGYSRFSLGAKPAYTTGLSGSILSMPKSGY